MESDKTVEECPLDKESLKEDNVHDLKPDFNVDPDFIQKTYHALQNSPNTISSNIIFDVVLCMWRALKLLKYIAPQWSEYTGGTGLSNSLYHKLSIQTSPSLAYLFSYYAAFEDTCLYPFFHLHPSSAMTQNSYLPTKNADGLPDTHLPFSHTYSDTNSIAKKFVEMLEFLDTMRKQKSCGSTLQGHRFSSTNDPSHQKDTSFSTTSLVADEEQGMKPAVGKNATTLLSTEKLCLTETLKLDVDEGKTPLKKDVFVGTGGYKPMDNQYLWKSLNFEALISCCKKVSIASPVSRTSNSSDTSDGQPVCIKNAKVAHPSCETNEKQNKDPDKILDTLVSLFGEIRSLLEKEKLKTHPRHDIVNKNDVESTIDARNNTKNCSHLSKTVVLKQVSKEASYSFYERHSCKSPVPVTLRKSEDTGFYSNDVSYIFQTLPVTTCETIVTHPSPIQVNKALASPLDSHHERIVSIHETNTQQPFTKNPLVHPKETSLFSTNPLQKANKKKTHTLINSEDVPRATSEPSCILNETLQEEQSPFKHPLFRPLQDTKKTLHKDESTCLLPVSKEVFQNMPYVDVSTFEKYCPGNKTLISQMAYQKKKISSVDDFGKTTDTKLWKKRNKETLKKKTPDTMALNTPFQGVCWDPTHQRWVAHWSDSETHQRIRKYFNPKLLGFHRARLHAILTRKEAVDSGRASKMTKSDKNKSTQDHSSSQLLVEDIKTPPPMKQTLNDKGEACNVTPHSIPKRQKVPHVVEDDHGNYYNASLSEKSGSDESFENNFNTASSYDNDTHHVKKSSIPSLHVENSIPGIYWSDEDKVWYAHWKPNDASQIHIEAFPVSEFLHQANNDAQKAALLAQKAAMDHRLSFCSHPTAPLQKAQPTPTRVTTLLEYKQEKNIQNSCPWLNIQLPTKFICNPSNTETSHPNICEPFFFNKRHHTVSESHNCSTN
ncbi:uncharacterized protein LOC128883089 [Hylaeus volcanicus]|uniref:uncharacterized protein LOC128883089 n=1 Tax=Hylaeus volcanicus TaxID=313075 RepID=UPI0023B7D37D|nr:uncharacterized protein LOC128883089 [Hylaeus volcanicus]